MNSELFATLPLTRLFFRCAVPSMIGMAVSALYAVADGIFVGRFIGRDALAAVNLVMPFIMIAFALSDLIATGASVQVARLLGERQNGQANRTFSFSLKMIFVLSVAVGLLGWFLAEPGLRRMGAEGRALSLAVEYLRVYALFAPVTIVFFATDNFLRICGREKFSMAINVVTSVLNIALDFLFICVLRQGVWSAAFASCVSIALGSVWSLVPFWRRKMDLRFAKGRIPLRQLGRLLANGSSEFFTSIAGSLFTVVLNAVLLALGGTVAVAAVSVIGYAESVVGQVIFGMVTSLQPALSYCYGARRMERVKALQKRVMLAAGGMSFLAFLFLRFGGTMVVPFFLQPGDTALEEMSLFAMRIYAWSYFVNWISPCLTGYLTALDRPAASLLASLGDTLVFPVTVLLCMAGLWGLDGVFFTPTVAGLLSAAVSGFIVRRSFAGKEAADEPLLK